MGQAEESQILGSTQFKGTLVRGGAQVKFRGLWLDGGSQSSPSREQMARGAVLLAPML